MLSLTKYSLMAAIAIIAGPLMSNYGIQEKKRLTELNKAGVTVPGEILGGRARTGQRRSSSYSFEVAFTSKEGQAITRKFEVRSDFFKAHSTQGSVRDAAVQVRYNPANVDEAILVGGSTDGTHFYDLGIGVGITGIIVLIVCFMLRKRAACDTHRQP